MERAFVLILLNKPYDVLTQFTDEAGRRTLKDFVPVPGVYPAGRLDRDSEGLVVLTDDGVLQARIASGGGGIWKTYLAQVEGVVGEAALARLRAGVELKDGLTLPARARAVAAPDWLWPRDPPIRVRQTVPDGWIELQLQEGRNRQVRRMVAAVGLPCLRLIRVAVGDWRLEGLAPGEWRAVETLALAGAGPGRPGGGPRPGRAAAKTSSSPPRPPGAKPPRRGPPPKSRKT